ncbi:MAG: hypothetical protein BSOLF_1250 [Candidatus Carbobacillus altaicus]|uniref:Uncharacterized protein n=1 Tax=Candidatus Carbonibacillus altaicus TaxID=2163959 RepID=A0A2R6Y4D5_9BACL|nr:MAG: hypothetical protein BSOLF_1250 [Candidatus Carbobacillus altaicus]
MRHLRGFRRRIFLTALFLVFYLLLPFALSVTDSSVIGVLDENISPVQPAWLWVYGVFLLFLAIFMIALEAYLRTKEEK